MLTVEQFSNSLIKFIDTEILPALKSTQLWVTTGILFLAQDKVPDLINSLFEGYPIIKNMVTDNSGLIDIDKLNNAVKQTCNKCGSVNINIPMLGTIELTDQNFDTLYKILKQENNKNE